MSNYDTHFSVHVLLYISSHRPSQDFSKVCQSEGTHQIAMSTSTLYIWLKKSLKNYGQDIVMAFSPPVVGCLVKKGLQKGEVTSTPGPPLATPLAAYNRKIEILFDYLIQSSSNHFKLKLISVCTIIVRQTK